MSPAERQRRRRERQRAGLVVLPIEADEVALAEMLVAAGYLRPAFTDDRDAIASALSAAVRDLTLVDVWPARHA